jgi:hypothetical protein
MRFLVFLFVSVFFSFTVQGQSNSWKLKKSADDVEVYFRKADNSPINEIKIQTLLSGTVKTLLEIMRNVPGYPQWVYKCTSAELVARPSPSGAIYYAVMDFPWPLSDRDFVAESKIASDNTGKVIITVNGVPGRVAERPERVRVPVMEYRWEFTPIDKTTIQLNYYLRSDPGGELPAWLINLVIDQGPTQTVKNLRQLLAEKNGQGKGS